MVLFELLDYKNLDSVFTLEGICFKEDAWSKKCIESEIDSKNSVFIVGRDEKTNDVCCYACLMIMYDFGEITNIAVSPAYRREGLAAFMINKLSDILKEKGIYRINLEVRRDNAAAIGLYEKLLFKKVGERKNYYKGKTDALLYTRILDKQA